MSKKVVLAFSGGLDTSYCVKYLSNELGLDVHSVIVNTGGFTPEELEEVGDMARNLGVVSHKAIEATTDFYEGCVRYLVFGNVLRNQTYPLSVSAERVFQAMAIAGHAQQIGADYIAHGSTGAGNDQVRFDLVFQVMAPSIEILTPIRDQQLSREAEIAYLAKHGVKREWKKAQYSINKGLWGTSVGGAETLTSEKPLPEEAYPYRCTREQPEKLTMAFEQGEVVAVNGERFAHPVQAIQAVEALAAPFAIGRDIHVGDTIIGIKGRVGFAAAAATILIKAHHLLEKHTLTKWQQHWKEQMGNWYGMMVHEGQFLEPTLRNIEVFLQETQQHVSGEVDLMLHPYRFELMGIRSAHDLMQSKFGSYGEMNLAWTGQDVKGFTKILANQIKIFNQVNGRGK